METPSKTHTWIMVLLVWIIALLVFLGGYMVYRDRTTDATVAIEGDTASCTAAIASAISDYKNENSDDAAAACPITDAYTSNNGPQFDYPIAWEVVVREVGVDRSARLIHVSKEPLFLCNACDGPFNAIDITLLKNNSQTTLDAYVASRYTAENGYRAVTKGAMDVNGTSVLRVKGQFDGMWSGAFEELVYVTDASIVVAGNSNTNDADTASAWEMVKSSLDFSNVE